MRYGKGVAPDIGNPSPATSFSYAENQAFSKNNNAKTEDSFDKICA